MKRLLLKYISIVVTIYLLSLLIRTMQIGSIPALLLMGLVLLSVNLILKPIMLIIALPFSILTLGLANFIVNAVTVMIADALVKGISMGGFLNSLIAATIISVFSIMTAAENAG